MRAVHADPAGKEDRLSAPALELQDLLHLVLLAAVGADDGGWGNDVAAERGRTSMETSQAVHIDLVKHTPLGREGQPIGVGRSNGGDRDGIEPPFSQLGADESRGRNVGGLEQHLVARYELHVPAATILSRLAPGLGFLQEGADLRRDLCHPRCQVSAGAELGRITGR